VKDQRIVRQSATQSTSLVESSLVAARIPGSIYPGVSIDTPT
jgi:hypothetical protein